MPQKVEDMLCWISLMKIILFAMLVKEAYYLIGELLYGW
jgi:hypothetical protein